MSLIKEVADVYDSDGIENKLGLSPDEIRIFLTMIQPILNHHSLDAETFTVDDIMMAIQVADKIALDLPLMHEQLFSLLKNKDIELLKVPYIKSRSELSNLFKEEPQRAQPMVPTNDTLITSMEQVPDFLYSHRRDKNEDEEESDFYEEEEEEEEEEDEEEEEEEEEEDLHEKYKRLKTEMKELKKRMRT